MNQNQDPGVYGLRLRNLDLPSRLSTLELPPPSPDGWVSSFSSREGRWIPLVFTRMLKVRQAQMLPSVRRSQKAWVAFCFAATMSGKPWRVVVSQKLRNISPAVQIDGVVRGSNLPPKDDSQLLSSTRPPHLVECFTFSVPLAMMRSVAFHTRLINGVQIS